MQTCPECGTRNAADAQFCSSCGTFLAWEDQQPPPHVPAPAPRPVPDPALSPPPPRPGRSSTRHDPEKVRKMPPDPVGQDDRTVALPRLPDHEPERRSSGPPPPPDGTDRSASPSTVRGPEPVPPSREPVAVPPGDTQAPPPRPAQQLPDVPAPGEAACPRCGAGNPSDRHFCRRCALELRRTVPREVSPSPAHPPRQRGTSPLVWVLLALAVLLLLLLGPQVLAALSASGPVAGAAAAACWAAPGHTGSAASPRERSMSQ